MAASMEGEDGLASGVYACQRKANKFASVPEQVKRSCLKEEKREAISLAARPSRLVTDPNLKPIYIPSKAVSLMMGRIRPSSLAEYSLIRSTTCDYQQLSVHHLTVSIVLPIII